MGRLGEVSGGVRLARLLSALERGRASGYMAVTWPLHGRYVALTAPALKRADGAVTWPLHGRYAPVLERAEGSVRELAGHALVAAARVQAGGEGVVAALAVSRNLSAMFSPVCGALLTAASGWRACFGPGGCVSWFVLRAPCHVPACTCHVAVLRATCSVPRGCLTCYVLFATCHSLLGIRHLQPSACWLLASCLHAAC